MLTFPRSAMINHRFVMSNLYWKYLPFPVKINTDITGMGLDIRKPVSGVYEQQRCRPACAYLQSDQHLCYSLIGKYHIKSCKEQNFNVLASLCSWTDWLEYDLVLNPRRQVFLQRGPHDSAYFCKPGTHDFVIGSWMYIYLAFSY